MEKAIAGIDFLSARAYSGTMNKEILTRLKGCKSYREIIKVVAQYSSRRPLSYSDIARLGGMSSRSLVRDIVVGRRRITHSNINGIVKGLKLKGRALTLFKLRVHLEEPDLKIYSYSPIIAENMLEKVLSGIERFSNRILIDEKRQKNIHLLKNYGQIFASLVGGKSGTSLSQISDISGIPVKELNSDIKVMEEQGLIHQLENKTFAPTSDFFDFSNKIDWSSRKIKLSDCSKKIDILLRNLEYYPDNTLFTETSFSIRESDIYILRKKLRGILSDLLVEMEYSGGDKTEIININLSMYSEKLFQTLKNK